LTYLPWEANQDLARYFLIVPIDVTTKENTTTFEISLTRRRLARVRVGLKIDLFDF